MFYGDAVLGLRRLCELQLYLHLPPLLTTVSCIAASMRNYSLLHVNDVIARSSPSQASRPTVASIALQAVSQMCVAGCLLLQVY
eukprot:16619-Heterococcus_DN1.PRE.3